MLTQSPESNARLLWKHLQDTPRNNVFSATQAFLSPIKLKYEINHHTQLRFHLGAIQRACWKNSDGKKKIQFLFCCCCCLVTKSCLTLCDPMDCSMPGSPVLPYCPECTQTQTPELVMPSNHLILCHPQPKVKDLRTQGATYMSPRVQRPEDKDLQCPRAGKYGCSSSR